MIEIEKTSGLTDWEKQEQEKDLKFVKNWYDLCYLADWITRFDQENQENQESVDSTTFEERN